MTITKRLGIGYATMSSVCVLLLGWLWYHEFVEEPAEFAALGLADVHKDTAAEFFTVCFLGLVPLLLGFGWWWTRRVLAPLRSLTDVVARIQSHNLHLDVPRSPRDDEVGTLSAVFSAMTGRLDESFRQIREFTLHASHELKTPLTVMRAQLENARRGREKSAPGEVEWIDSQIDEVERLAKIVDALALLTKADAGLVVLERALVPFEALVMEIHEDAQILAQPYGVRVYLDTCVAVSVIGDRHRLRQLLLILVDNAVKYNRPEGEVRISLHSVEGNLVLQITNEGGGISLETRHRLFERFVRGENAVGRVEGCGLGLTIAHWIVRTHGGTIEVRPEGTDRTTVVVQLPLAVPAPEPV